MRLEHQVHQALYTLPHVEPTADAVQQLLAAIDLTSLHEHDDLATITTLCQRATTAYGPVAALCLKPHLVKEAKALLLNTPIRIATVANFPTGQEPLLSVLQTITKALDDGIDEIDVVFPYQHFLADEQSYTFDFIAACRTKCANQCLKVILETGALLKLPTIYNASLLAIKAGADFIKTSTGKMACGATLDAGATILLAIQESHKPIGFKASGGIRSLEQAIQYWQLVKHVRGEHWTSPAYFRLGVSQLLDVILHWLASTAIT